jgi:pimeloyl-ACP methyl ester carboxylesterase
MLTIVSIFLACILILVSVLLLWSYPGKSEPFVDENGSPLAGSISEKIHININGVEQGMFIKGRDVNNPVLLFLHGGPGMPEYFLTQSYPTGLEEYFTVVWWDRRGAGLSYSPDIPLETMTVEQSILDTLAVTNYLRQRFGTEKIYLMGHSGGSFIGIQAAARAPELYYAYIGMAQMVYQVKSEKLAYEYMLPKFRENGNTRMARILEENPVTMTVPLPPAYAAARDEAMHTLGIGTTRDMKSVVTGIFLPSWTFPEYTLGEKVNLWRGKFFSHAILWDEMIATDLAQQVPELDLPVYFFHGIYDYACSYTEAKSYFEQLRAPLKGFYTFEQSAHSPIFEEPEKVQQILQEDVLAGANNLADR